MCWPLMWRDYSLLGRARLTSPARLYIARLDTLFLAMPVSWKGTLIQYSGGLHRHHPGKTEVRIYDYVDREVPMLVRMFDKRLRTYRAIGYARGEAPLGFAEAPEESVVEYDDQTLRHFEQDV